MTSLNVGDTKITNTGTTSSTLDPSISKGPTSVIVHPLVLLSVVDHYNRVALSTSRRVVGVLLGSTNKGQIDCTNSFAIPFEEDNKNPGDVWYLDHNYLETMFAMFKKISAKERVIGFYSTGPEIRGNDIKIWKVLKRYTVDPVLVVIDIRSGMKTMPVKGYKAVEEVDNMTGNVSEIGYKFKHIDSMIGALEAEEVGVEHLLRDINDPTVSSTSSQITAKISSLKTLSEKLKEMQTYLEACIAGTLIPNTKILSNMQEIFNLLPNLNLQPVIEAMLTKTNDMYFVIYLGSLIRAVTGLHELVRNKIEFKVDEGLGDVGVAGGAKKSKIEVGGKK